MRFFAIKVAISHLGGFSDGRVIYTSAAESGIKGAGRGNKNHFGFIRTRTNGRSPRKRPYYNVIIVSRAVDLVGAPCGLRVPVFIMFVRCFVYVFDAYSAPVRKKKKRSSALS